MSAFLEGIGKVIGKIADHIQGRVERAKNKIKKLEIEREDILSKPSSLKAIKRLDDIERELVGLRNILEANAKD